MSLFSFFFFSRVKWWWWWCQFVFFSVHCASFFHNYCHRWWAYNHNNYPKCVFLFALHTHFILFNCNSIQKEVQLSLRPLTVKFATWMFVCLCKQRKNVKRCSVHFFKKVSLTVSHFHSVYYYLLHTWGALFLRQLLFLSSRCNSQRTETNATQRKRKKKTNTLDTLGFKSVLSHFFLILLFLSCFLPMSSLSSLLFFYFSFCFPLSYNASNCLWGGCSKRRVPAQIHSSVVSLLDFHFSKKSRKKKANCENVCCCCSQLTTAAAVF